MAYFMLNLYLGKEAKHEKQPDKKKHRELLERTQVELPLTFYFKRHINFL